MQYSVQPMGYPQSGGQLGYLQPGFAPSRALVESGLQGWRERGREGEWGGWRERGREGRMEGERESGVDEGREGEREGWRETDATPRCVPEPFQFSARRTQKLTRGTSSLLLYYSRA